MKITRVSKFLYRKKYVYLLSVFFLLSFLSLKITLMLPKGGVWENHVECGLLFLKGLIPKTPAYPMWGYSLLAGLFNEKIVIFQGMLLFIICVYWYDSLIKYSSKDVYHSKLVNIICNPNVIAIILAPFFFLSYSYFSNSISTIFVFIGAWILYIAVENRNTFHFIVSAFFIGLSFHFRSESLLLGILFIIALLVFGVIKHSAKYYLRRAFLFFITLFITILPWIIYTGSTLNKVELSSTNAGAVMYIGLGTLPGNPWYITENDSYAHKIALERSFDSPWSSDANKYFRQQYYISIKKYPIAFLKRVLLGCRHMLTQGLYFPNFRNCFYFTKEDAVAIDFINESLKQAIGLSVNSLEMEQYKLSRIVFSYKHYAIVFLEYGLRFLYLCIFIVLLILCFKLSLETKFNYFISYLYIVHLIFILFTAGFIQTLPRHTTLVLPIFLSSLIVLGKQASLKQTLN